MEFDRRFVDASTPVDVQGDGFNRAGGIDLIMLWEIFRRNFRELMGIALLGVGLMGLYLMVAPKSYTASGSIVLDSRQPKLFNIDGMLASADTNQDNIDTQIGLLRSTRIAERVLDILEERGIPLPAVSKSADVGVVESGHPGGAAHPSGELRDPSMIDAIQRRLKIERKGRSLLVDVMYSDTNPVRAAGIANAFMDGYISDQLRSRSAATQSNSKVLKERVDELRKELVNSEEQIQKYKAEHDIVELGTLTLAQQEVANHEQELAKVRAMAAQADARVGQVGSMANELARDAAKSQVKILEGGLEALKQKVQKSSELLLKLDELRRDSDALKTTYVAVLNRYRETQAQENAISPDAQIVNYAVPPSTPSFPKNKLMLALALFGSLLMGTMALLLTGILRAKIYTIADVERIFGFQPLTLVPEVRNLKTDVRRLAANGSFNGTPSEKFEQSVFTLRRWAESTSNSRNSVIAVVSNNAGDGCSTLAAALAFSAARSGRKTLLIDADFRNRGLTRAFSSVVNAGDAEVNGSDGIVSLGHALPDFRAASLSDGQSALDVLDGPVLSGILDKVRQNYELTIIDTAPAGSFVDAGAVIDVAHGVIVVLRAGDTTRGDAENMIRQIADCEPKPVGVVLNRIPLRGIKKVRDFLPEAWLREFSERLGSLKSRIRSAW